MSKRWSVIAYWLFFHTMLFIFFGMFMHPIVSANIAMIITISAFCSDRNKADRDALTRPTLFINYRSW